MYVWGRGQLIGDCSASQGQKMLSDPMELGLQVLVSHNTFVRAAKPGSPWRASVLENQLLSPLSSSKVYLTAINALTVQISGI